MWLKFPVWNTGNGIAPRPILIRGGERTALGIAWAISYAMNDDGEVVAEMFYDGAKEGSKPAAYYRIRRGGVFDSMNNPMGGGRTQRRLYPSPPVFSQPQEIRPPAPVGRGNHGQAPLRPQTSPNRPVQNQRQRPTQPYSQIQPPTNVVLPRRVERQDQGDSNGNFIDPSRVNSEALQKAERLIENLIDFIDVSNNSGQPLEGCEEMQLRFLGRVLVGARNLIIHVRRRQANQER